MEKALRVLEDPDRQFLTSPFVQRELAPKVAFYGKGLEKSFYDAFIQAAEWRRDLDAIVSLAQVEAEKHGRPAIDALHPAAVHILGADGFVTTERCGKPLYRTSLVAVIYLFA